MVPASFDFCRANLNEASSAGTSIPSDNLCERSLRTAIRAH